MKSKSHKVSFITVNYNGIVHTDHLLQTIFEKDFIFDFEVIVMDNGSQDNEFAVLQARYPRIKGAYLIENLGFAGGNNRAIEQASGEYLYFINNDTLLPDDAGSQIESMINFCSAHPQVGGLSPKIMYAVPENLIQFAGSSPLSAITLRNQQLGYRELDQGQYDQIRQIPYFHGAAMFVPKIVIDQVGVLPECYFLYYEELDWSCTITKHFELYYFPQAFIYHLESASTGIESPFKIFYLTRNRIIFAYRQRRQVVRLLALCYLTFIAFPSNICIYLFKCKLQHCWAMVRGLSSAYRWILGLNRDI